MKIIKFWFPVIVYSGIIFYVSSLQSVKTPGLPGFDKVLHVFEYMPFGYLAARAIFHTKDALNVNMLFIMVLLISLLYGISDEYHQSFVAGRTPSLIDVLADMVGGMTGGYIYLRLKINNWVNFRGVEQENE